MATAPDYEYVATEPIHYNGVLAYNTGDPVPADNVKKNNWEKLVQKAGRRLPADAPEARSVGAASTPPARQDEANETASKSKASDRGASSGK